MTEEDARALLRDVAVPSDKLTQPERAWIAERPWHATGQGWVVEGMREGVRYHVDRVPGAELARALFVVSGVPATGEVRPGAWIEARGW